MGAVLVIFVVPVRVAAVDVCLGVEAVKTTSPERVTRVAGLDAQSLHAVTHLGILGAEVLTTLALAAISKPPQCFLAQHVPSAAAEISLHKQRQASILYLFITCMFKHVEYLAVIVKTRNSQVQGKSSGTAYKDVDMLSRFFFLFSLRMSFTGAKEERFAVIISNQAEWRKATLMNDPRPSSSRALGMLVQPAGTLYRTTWSHQTFLLTPLGNS